MVYTGKLINGAYEGWERGQDRRPRTGPEWKNEQALRAAAGSWLDGSRVEGGKKVTDSPQITPTMLAVGVPRRRG